MIKKYKFKPEPQFHMCNDESIAIPLRSHPDGLIICDPSTPLLDMGTYRTPFYGVELEIEHLLRPEMNSKVLKTNKIETIIWKVMSKINNLGFYVKTDSSLTNGLEIVSHPRTYKSWLSKQREMRDLFTSLLKNNMSGATPRCGFHVHIGHDSWMSLSHYIRFSMLLCELQPLLISKERNSYERVQQYCAPVMDWRDIVWKFAQIQGYDLISMGIIRPLQGEQNLEDRVHHHSAINVTKETTEVRFFRGVTSTLSFYKILATLEYLRQYTAQFGSGYTKDYHFKGWLDNQAGKDAKIARKYLSYRKCNDIKVQIDRSMSLFREKSNNKKVLRAVLTERVEVPAKFKPTKIASIFLTPDEFTYQDGVDRAALISCLIDTRQSSYQDATYRQEYSFVRGKITGADFRSRNISQHFDNLFSNINQIDLSDLSELKPVNEMKLLWLTSDEKYKSRICAMLYHMSTAIDVAYDENRTLSNKIIQDTIKTLRLGDGAWDLKQDEIDIICNFVMYVFLSPYSDLYQEQIRSAITFRFVSELQPTPDILWDFYNYLQELKQQRISRFRSFLSDQYSTYDKADKDLLRLAIEQERQGLFKESIDPDTKRLYQLVMQFAVMQLDMLIDVTISSYGGVPGPNGYDIEGWASMFAHNLNLKATQRSIFIKALRGISPSDANVSYTRTTKKMTKKRFKMLGKIIGWPTYWADQFIRACTNAGGASTEAVVVAMFENTNLSYRYNQNEDWLVNNDEDSGDEQAPTDMPYRA